MKKIFLLLFIYAVIYGCKKDNLETKGIPVNLIGTDDPFIFKKSVVLYDQSDFLIKTPLDTFLLGYPFLWGGYDGMRTKAVYDGQLKDILKVSDYIIYNGDSIYTLAYYLETGKCFLFDNKGKKSIKTILVETYFEGEPMASHGGRRFYINNRLFLETIDMVSK